MARKIGDRQLEGNNLWNLAVALNESKDETQAISHAEAALKIFQAIEDPNIANVLEQLEKWRVQK